MLYVFCCSKWSNDWLLETFSVDLCVPLTYPFVCVCVCVCVRAHARARLHVFALLFIYFKLLEFFLGLWKNYAESIKNSFIFHFPLYPVSPISISEVYCYNWWANFDTLLAKCNWVYNRVNFFFCTFSVFWQRHNVIVFIT